MGALISGASSVLGSVLKPAPAGPTISGISGPTVITPNFGSFSVNSNGSGTSTQGASAGGAGTTLTPTMEIMFAVALVAVYFIARK